MDRPPPPGYVLTGPIASRHGEIVEVISTALDRPIRYVDLSPDDMTRRLVDQGMPAEPARISRH